MQKGLTMGRMLKALQQVGGAMDSGGTVRPLTGEELATFGLSPQTAPPPNDPSSDPKECSAEPSARLAPPPQGSAVATPEPAVAVLPVEPTTTADPQPGEPGQGWSVATTLGAEAVESEVPSASEEEAASDLDPLLGDAVRQRQRQYRNLAGNLLAKIPPGRSGALLFTHAGDLEENTSMLAELATAMSRRLNGEVIIVDADFHHPYLGHFLGIESDRSLVDVLWDAADWQEVVRWTKSARISILPGGRSPRTWQSSETTRLAQLLDELRSHYDLILLQAASAGYPEVGVLARHSDATYLTIQLGRVTRRQVRQAASALQRAGAALLGGIVLD